jgi:hypothetical protein
MLQGVLRKGQEIQIRPNVRISSNYGVIQRSQHCLVQSSHENDIHRETIFI